MIKTPTVLVLGAGASVDFGYPTGKNLKQKIINAFRSTEGRALYELGHTDVDVRNFREAFFHAGIRIMSEKDIIVTNFEPARYQIQQAKRIIFLGFHFHPNNISRLSIDLQLPITYYGTVYDLTPLEVQGIKRHFGTRSIHLGNAKTLDFIRKKIEL